MTILPHMKKLLEDRGFAMAPIVLGRYPAAPDIVLALREMVEVTGDLFGSDNLPLLGAYELHMTARCGKDAGAGTALNILWDAYRRISGRHINVTVNGLTYRFSWIRPMGSPQIANYDANDRPEAVARFSVQRVESLEVPYGA